MGICRLRRALSPRAVTLLTMTMRWLTRSIPGRLIGLYVALTVLSLVTITTLVYRSTRDVLLASVHQQLRTITADKSDLISRWLSEREHDVEVVAKNAAVVEHASLLVDASGADVPASRRTVETLLRLICDQYGAYHEIRIVDAEETLLATSSRGKNIPRVHDPAMFAAVQQGRRYVSHAYAHPALGTLCLDVASPLVSPAGKRLGAVVATVDLDTVREMAVSTGSAASGVAYLVDEHGKLLAFRDRQPVDRNDRSDVPAVAAVIGGKSGLAEYVDHRGVAVVGAYRWLPRWRWGLIAEVHRDEVLAPIRQARTQLLLIVGLVTLAVLLGTLLIVRSLLRPLRALTEAVQAVASGQLDQRVEIAGDDEVAHLSRSFNQMATNLAEMRAGMAASIREATGSVESKNTQLGEANEELQVAIRELDQQRAMVERSARLAAMGEMAAGIAHEINNPLTTMKNLVYSLRASVPEEDIRGRDLAVVLEEIEKLNRLVVNFLKYARPPKANIRPVDTADIVEHTLKLLEPQANQRQLTMVSSVDAELPLVMADREQLTQVLVNLVLNAIQASPEGGEVRVSAAAEAEPGQSSPTRVELTVSDQGPGVSEKSRQRVFNPFFTTKADGSGLGLAISQRIVEEHGGTLDLSSVFGQGACFVVTLTRLAEYDDPASDKENSHHEPHSNRG